MSLLNRNKPKKGNKEDKEITFNFWVEELSDRKNIWKIVKVEKYDPIKIVGNKRYIGKLYNKRRWRKKVRDTGDKSFLCEKHDKDRLDYYLDVEWKTRRFPFSFFGEVNTILPPPPTVHQVQDPR